MQLPDSHPQEQPHWHTAAGFTLILRVFGFLRFDFIIIDLVTFHSAVPALSTGITDRSSELMDQHQIHYTSLFRRIISMAMRCVVRFVARAIDAAMSAGGAAISGQSFAQVFSRSVQFHRQVIPRYAQPDRNRIRLLPFQVHRSQQLAILLRHQGHQPRPAPAQNPRIGDPENISGGERIERIKQKIQPGFSQT